VYETVAGITRGLEVHALSSEVSNGKATDVMPLFRKLLARILDTNVHGPGLLLCATVGHSRVKAYFSTNPNNTKTTRALIKPQTH